MHMQRSNIANTVMSIIMRTGPERRFLRQACRDQRVYPHPLRQNPCTVFARLNDQLSFDSWWKQHAIDQYLAALLHLLAHLFDLVEEVTMETLACQGCLKRDADVVETD